MEPVRLAVIGLGGMGRVHVKNLRGSKLTRLVALADLDVDNAREVADELRAEDRTDVAVFADHEALLQADLAEAVLIVTPHPSHTQVAIACFEAGLHVLCEKPLAERVSYADRILAAADKAGTVFAVMLQHRMHGLKRRLRRLIREGELGRPTRMHFVATDSYRSQTYYDSAAWRGTWAGEGGGVLMNQAPHHLDQVIWQMGPVKRVLARCRTSDVHRIEIEDDAEALIDFAGGAVGFFSATTCELPGVFRIEVSGDRGLARLAEKKLTVWRTNYSVRDFNQADAADKPEELEVGQPETLEPDEPVVGEHLGICENFCRAIRSGEPLIAPGHEGLGSLELANAMVLSSELGAWVDLPLDRAAYDELADRLIGKRARRASRDHGSGNDS